MNAAHRRSTERGSVMLLVITIILVISMLAMANAMALHSLRRELKHLNEKHEKRLQQVRR